MKIYNGQIEKAEKLLKPLPFRKFQFNAADCRENGEKSTVIFRNETAFELGSMGKQSVCSVMFSDENRVKDEVLLYGKDIGELNSDSSFAHIVTVGLDSSLSEEDFLYEELKDIEFAVFRISPVGYCVTLSPMSGREQVRVSKKAVENGLSFYNIGCSYIEEFKKNPMVKSISVCFVTDPDFDYRAMKLIADGVNKITGALTSRFKNTELDCASCSMKAICDEVEGLRELHFKNV